MSDERVESATRFLYVETSALLRALIEGDPMLARAFTTADRLVSSALTLVEAEHGLRRGLSEKRLDPAQLRAGQQWLAAFERSCELMSLTEAVLAFARRSFPVEPIRTLDAIHLATIKLWDTEVGPVTVMSTDRRVRDNAVAWGLPVLPAAG